MTRPPARRQERMSRNEAIGRVRIVHILEGFAGGTATYICTVLPQLIEQDYDVTLICSLERGCSDAQERIAQLRNRGVKVHVVPMRRRIDPLQDLRSFTAILRLLLSGDFQIVHTHCSKAGALGRLAAVVARKNVRFHSPHCFAFARTSNRFLAALYLLLERWLGKLTTTLLAIGESEARLAVERGIVPASRCITVRNGLADDPPVPETRSLREREEIKQSLGIAGNGYVVSTACRLVRYKGLSSFLAAAGLCRTPNVTFLIAGEGGLQPALEEYIRAHELESKVRLLGHVADIRRLYAVSDLFVLCSEAEAQPYVLLEAMRARCPILATSVVGTRDLIRHNRTGVLVDPRAEAIAGSIDELLNDRVKCRELTENAYRHFRQHHLLERQVSLITSAYDAHLPQQRPFRRRSIVEGPRVRAAR